MCDNFEARVAGVGDLKRAIFKNEGWATSDPYQVITTNEAFAGSNGYEFLYPRGPGGGGYNDTPFRGRYGELYARWYTKFGRNFVPDSHQDAHGVLAGNTAQHNFFALGGSWAPVILFQEPEPRRYLWGQNVNGVATLGVDRWYCLEVRVKLNSTGAADGVLQGWIDGVQHWNYLNVQLTSTAGAYYEYFRFATSRADGNANGTYRWHDNIVVSRQRIGCLP